MVDPITAKEARRVSPRYGWGRWLSVLPTLGVVVVAGASIVRADQLVLRDGTRVDTVGPWQEEDSRIVFEMPNGTLASLPADEVDLAATRELAVAESSHLQEVSDSEPVKQKKAVMVLTDADVGHPKVSSRGSEEDAADEPAGGSPAAGDVVVASWNSSDLPNDEGIRIIGTVRNTLPHVAADLNIAVLAYDSTDELLVSVPANLGARALGPGQTTSIMADLGMVFSFSRVEFDIAYSRLERRSDPEVATSTRRPESR
jgi:hypothetical protein